MLLLLLMGTTKHVLTRRMQQAQGIASSCWARNSCLVAMAILQPTSSVYWEPLATVRAMPWLLLLLLLLLPDRQFLTQQGWCCSV